MFITKSIRIFKGNHTNLRILIKLLTFLIVFVLCFTPTFCQQLDSDDYKVYSAIIKTEILDTTASVVVIRTNIDSGEVNRYMHYLIHELRSNDFNIINQVYFWTENESGKRPTIIDSSTRNYIIKYCESSHDKFNLTNKFNLNAQVFIVERNPIKNYKNWNAFYKKYPGSGGIFSFSEIKYVGKDSNTAMAYYWHCRNGYNGHGALAILSRNDSKWEIKYKYYIWWN
jgi:hypothetical protein